MAATTETRGEFRKRITTVAHSAMPLPPGDAEYWSQPYGLGDPCHHMPMQKTDFTEVAEAVYAQALREFGEAFGGYYGGTGSYPSVRDMIQEFAAGRGIDLTESEDK